MRSYSLWVKWLYIADYLMRDFFLYASIVLLYLGFLQDLDHFLVSNSEEWINSYQKMQWCNDEIPRTTTRLSYWDREMLIVKLLQVMGYIFFPVFFSFNLDLPHGKTLECSVYYCLSIQISAQWIHAQNIKIKSLKNHLNFMY